MHLTATSSTFTLYAMPRHNYTLYITAESSDGPEAKQANHDAKIKRIYVAGAELLKKLDVFDDSDHCLRKQMAKTMTGIVTMLGCCFA